MVRETYNEVMNRERPSASPRERILFVPVSYGLIVACFFLFGLRGDAVAAIVDVTIQANGGFSPSSVTINSGDTVRWTATGDGEQVSGDQHPSHELYSDPKCPNAGCWDSPLLFANNTFSFTFKIGGTWGYHNHQTPGRTGTVIVSDTNAPAVVSNLSAANPTTNSIGLSWASPGDDVGNTGNFGTPASYDVRYSTSSINDSNWSSATQVSGEPTPLVAGSNQTMTVSGLNPSTTYYFALKTSDEVPNQSVLSNVASLATGDPSDTTSPGNVTNLAASNPTTSSVALSWTAPGDDGNVGTAATYDIRYSTSNITDSNWGSATQVLGEPAPHVSGTAESMTVSGLSAGTLTYFAIKTSDDSGNQSGISNVVNITTVVLASGAQPTGDTTPPKAVTDLMVSSSTASSVSLSWTAQGDDGDNSASAASYDIRYARIPISDSNWGEATQLLGLSSPLGPHLRETITAFSLAPQTTYYFALKISDEAKNESGLSNVVEAKTSGIARVTDLLARNLTNVSLDLVWTVPKYEIGEGVSLLYDIRYSTDILTETSWGDATEIIEENMTPGIAGEIQALAVSGILPNTRYYFALFIRDSKGNSSLISNVADIQTLSFEIIPPSSIFDLDFRFVSISGVEFRWTSPGDDGNIGAAAEYEIRYMKTDPLTDENWDTALRFLNPPTPQPSGVQESFTIPGFDHNTTYYVAIKTRDEAGNESEISNIVNFTTPPEPVYEDEITLEHVREGTFLRVHGTIYVHVIREGKKLWIPTAKNFVESGYEWGNIRNVSVGIISVFPSAKLLRVKGRPEVYEVTGLMRRHILSPEAFEREGHDWSDILTVNIQELAWYTETNLIRGAGDEKTYLITENFMKRWFVTEEVFLEQGYNWQDILVVRRIVIESYPTGEPIE